VVVFQPHRYSRTRDLADEFAHAFEQADVVYVLDIYPGGEEPLPGISGQTIVEKIQGAGHPAVHWVNGDPGLIARLQDELREGDVLLTLGAGDVGKIGKELFEALGSET
jgi:UDP-N-acetylmuramate--alanine ligase